MNVSNSVENLTESPLLNFFDGVPGFTNFEQSFQSENYRDVPDEMILVLTDVVGSTKAIESGNYKEVNTIGAATLAAIQNGMGKERFAFVFGGDGSTALIPPHAREAVERELNGLRNVSTSQFQLELRVALIPTSEIVARGGNLRLSKFILDGGYPLAVFRGGGLTLAESLLKKSEEFLLPSLSSKETDLRSLSCRWQTIVSPYGNVVSLLLYVPQDSDMVYLNFYEDFTHVLSIPKAKMNPVTRKGLRYRTLTELLGADWRYQRSFFSLIARALDSILARIIFGWGLVNWIQPLRHYVDATPAHCDYRKVDDMLRMIFSCPPEDLPNIRKLCERYREDEGVFYGIHASENALMTCYVPSFGDGEHIHFIDGGSGGYAMAAKELKEQMKGYPAE